ncbi:hypothetical protein PYCCODRAFT_1177062 [Trametes coccinea BRFM310]|uniref:Uncharacterized protein n=1 Tax=Trametes coccinea (strain BRFM310) TaxID=1353009 RepID=A0A1Y2IXB1_TRAC3|nr:hypothetical protein PYCCODRAFT_1177062 [Trametes coccinea BRFM310]
MRRRVRPAHSRVLRSRGRTAMAAVYRYRRRGCGSWLTLSDRRRAEDLLPPRSMAANIHSRRGWINWEDNRLAGAIGGLIGTRQGTGPGFEGSAEAPVQRGDLTAGCWIDGATVLGRALEQTA